ncbi:acireductone dioxygenase-like [Amphiura filiformis]|uniref:acireductone dioxygenase-like n=1 Tax=Amphiura filiformis TaxID=82378 RepID=UPI003B214F2C
MPGLKAWLSGTEPKQYLSDADLNEIGVKYWVIDADNWKAEGKIDKICEERNYWNYGHKRTTREMVLEYNKEHLHEQDEVLFFLDGAGYIEMRDKQERWIHVPVVKGILYVFPAGVYHRLRLETDVCNRLSIRANKKLDPTESGLKYHYRPADEMDCRKQYLERLSAGNFP